MLAQVLFALKACLFVAAQFFIKHRLTEQLQRLFKKTVNWRREILNAMLMLLQFAVLQFVFIPTLTYVVGLDLVGTIILANQEVRKEIQALEEFKIKREAKESIAFQQRKHKKYIQHLNVVFLLFSLYMYLGAMKAGDK